MKLYTIDTGYFKLDGGAMFGVVPKVLWGKVHPADERNLCTWAMRCLLVETDGRLILIDNGIGAKQDAKFFGHYHLHGDATLEGSLKKHGFTPEDIEELVEKTLPQHRVTKLSPRPAGGADLNRMFAESMQIW